MAAIAIGHIGDVLAAPEPALQKTVNELNGFIMGQMGEKLALQPSRQIGAALRRRHIKFRKMLLQLRHNAA